MARLRMARRSRRATGRQPIPSDTAVASASAGQACQATGSLRSPSSSAATREANRWQRKLCETAARTNGILALDLEDLDLARERAVVIGKGGHREVVVWASGTAGLLPRCLIGRRRGPVFVTSRQPNLVPADRDRCPDTGRGRLSYQIAWKLFSRASDGATLHQLRHSTLTYLGEEGVSTVLLQAKSRHQDPRPWLATRDQVCK